MGTKFKNSKKEKKNKRIAIARAKRKYTEDEVVEQIVSQFPEYSRIKKIATLAERLDSKQLKKLEKNVNFVERCPIEIRLELGMNDPDTRILRKQLAKEKAEEEARDLAERTRNVDEKTADEANAIREDLAKLRAANTTKKNTNLLNKFRYVLNQRYVSLFVGAQRIRTQIMGHSSAVMIEMAAKHNKSSLARNASDGALLSAIFAVDRTTPYDVDANKFKASTKLDEASYYSPFDPIEDFNESDESEDVPEFQLSTDQKPEIATANYGKRKNNNKVVAADADDEDDYQEGLVESPDSVTDTGEEPGKKKERKQKSTIMPVGGIRVRYAHKSYEKGSLSTIDAMTQGLFNGRHRFGVVGLTFGCVDLKNTLSTRVSGSNDVPNRLIAGQLPSAFRESKELFQEFAVELGKKIGFTFSSHVPTEAILGRQMFQFLSQYGFIKGGNIAMLYRQNKNSSAVYGVLLLSNNNGDFITLPFGLMSVTEKEIEVLTSGEYAGEAISRRGTFEFVVHSIVSNGVCTSGRVFGTSLVDRSLLTPIRPGGNKDIEKVIKTPDGYIFHLPDVDRRMEFADYVESSKLPEQLSDFMIDKHGESEYDKFVGRVVYTDLENNIVYYYSGAGRLMKAIYEGAAELNYRDMSNIMKPQPKYSDSYEIEEGFDVTNADHRAVASKYGATVPVPTSYFYPHTLSQLYNNKASVKLKSVYEAGHENFLIGVEQLRESYNGDRVLYDAVDAIVEEVTNMSPEADPEGFPPGLRQHYNNYTMGAAYMLFDKANGGLSDRAYNSTGYLHGRGVTALRIALYAARQPLSKWPDRKTLHELAENSYVKPPSPNDLEAVTGNYDGLARNKDGEFPTAMPHQAYILATAQRQRGMALDCDMGGGKTFMSAMDCSYWLKNGVDNKPARVCVIMPAGLIENYMTDLKNNFFGNNVKYFVLSSTTRQWARKDNSKIREIAMKCPINTIFLASYEWLGNGSYEVAVGMEECFGKVPVSEIEKYNIRRDVVVAGHGTDKEALARAPKGDEAKERTVRTSYFKTTTKEIFPNAQLLLDIGVNVVYLDESQMIKNPSSNKHKAVQMLSEIPIKRIMTGTMVTRDVDDVFTQTSFIDGTMIGTRGEFQREFCTGQEAIFLGRKDGGGAGAVEDEKKKKSKSGVNEIDRGKEKAARKLLNASGVMNIRRSMWIGILPKKTETTEFVDLDETHQMLFMMLFHQVRNGDYEEMMKLLEQLKGSNDPKDRAMYAKLHKMCSALFEKFVGASGDDKDDDSSGLSMELEKARKTEADEAFSDEEDSDNATPKKEARGSDLVNKILEKKQKIIGKLQMLQSFISAPEVLVPENISPNARQVMDAENLVIPEVTGKDRRIIELIDKHWKSGFYKPSSEQVKNHPENRVGKIIIFGINIATVKHVYDFLKKSKYASVVGRFVKADSDATETLEKFKDKENAEVSILVACEQSIIYGHNMQAANIMINVTVPWTTGDYDQKLARIFRNGQKLPCYIYNLIAQSTFDTAKFLKFLIRQNSNRKLMSDYDNKYNLPAGLGTMTDVKSLFLTKADFTSFGYVDPLTQDEVNVNLLDLHDSIYEHELEEANTHKRVFEQGGYGDITKTRIEVASGKEQVDSAFRPVDSEGNTVTCLDANTSLESLSRDFMEFNGDNLTVGINRLKLSHEKRNDALREKALEMGVLEDFEQELRYKEFDDYVKQAIEKESQDPELSVYTQNKGLRVYLNRAFLQADFSILGDDFPALFFGAKIGNMELIEERKKLIDMFRRIYNNVIAKYPGLTQIQDEVLLFQNKRKEELQFPKNEPTIVTRNTKLLVDLFYAGLVKKKTPFLERDGKPVAPIVIKPNPEATQDKVVKKRVADEDADKSLKTLEDETEDTVEDADNNDDNVSRRIKINYGPGKVTDTKVKIIAPTKSGNSQRVTPTVPQAIVENQNGMLFGISEFIVFDHEETKRGINSTQNDLLYIFAPIRGNNPKDIRKLDAMNFGSGRNPLQFDKKNVWFHPEAITSKQDVEEICKLIERNGGYVAKETVGNRQTYAILNSPDLEAMLRVKVPAKARNMANDVSSLHAVTAAAGGMRKEVDLAFSMIDRKIVLMAICKDAAILRSSGFRMAEILRCQLVNDASVARNIKKLMSGVKTVVEIRNPEILARRFKLITGVDIKL